MFSVLYFAYVLGGVLPPGAVLLQVALRMVVLGQHVFRLSTARMFIQMRSHALCGAILVSAAFSESVNRVNKRNIGLFQG